MQSQTVSGYQTNGQLATIFEVRESVPIWEQAFIALWLFITYLPLSGVSPLRFLSIAIFMGLLVIHHKQTVPVLLRSWLLFTLPVLGLLSFTWSPYPAEALRTGIFYILTPLVVVVMASRLTVHQILRCTMFAGVLATLYSVPYFSQFSEGGPYSGKNIFAIQMLFAMLTSLAVALNPKENTLVRLFALPFVPICFVFQLLADSATSLVFGVLGIIALFGVKFVWENVSRVRYLPTVLLGLMIIIALTVFLVLVSMPQSSILDYFLGLVGKDSSFTGRTDLWTGAEIQSAKHPWFGVGLEGFWQYDTGLAQTLNENNHKDYGTKLSFHNAFWEVRVHLGYVGLIMFSMIVGWSFLRTVRLWFADMSVSNSALLVCVVIILTSTLTESYLWGTFNTMANLFFVGAIAGFRRPEKVAIGQVPLKTNSAQGAAFA